MKEHKVLTQVVVTNNINSHGFKLKEVVRIKKKTKHGYLCFNENEEWQLSEEEFVKLSEWQKGNGQTLS